MCADLPPSPFQFDPSWGNVPGIHQRSSKFTWNAGVGTGHFLPAEVLMIIKPPIAMIRFKPHQHIGIL